MYGKKIGSGQKRHKSAQKWPRRIFWWLHNKLLLLLQLLHLLRRWAPSRCVRLGGEPAGGEQHFFAKISFQNISLQDSSFLYLLIDLWSILKFIWITFTAHIIGNTCSTRDLVGIGQKWLRRLQIAKIAPWWLQLLYGPLSPPSIWETLQQSTLYQPDIMHQKHQKHILFSPHWYFIIFIFDCLTLVLVSHISPFLREQELYLFWHPAKKYCPPNWKILFEKYTLEIYIWGCQQILLNIWRTEGRWCHDFWKSIRKWQESCSQ